MAPALHSIYREMVSPQILCPWLCLRTKLISHETGSEFSVWFSIEFVESCWGLDTIGYVIGGGLAAHSVDGAHASTVEELEISSTPSYICLKRTLEIFGYTARRKAMIWIRWWYQGMVKEVDLAADRRWCSDQVQQAANTIFYNALRRAKDWTKWEDFINHVQDHSPQSWGND